MDANKSHQMVASELTRRTTKARSTHITIEAVKAANDGLFATNNKIGTAIPHANTIAGNAPIH